MTKKQLKNIPSPDPSRQGMEGNLGSARPGRERNGRSNYPSPLMGEGKGGGEREHQGGVQKQADELLAEILAVTAEIGIRELAHNRQIEEITAAYHEGIGPQRETLKRVESELIALMKSSKGSLFDGIDIVNLPHGSLIHSLVDKVKIPRDRDAVIALCEELGFSEVVKIAKSLDREMIEKWPDGKLFLIGAERKPKEEFSYDLKKDSK